MAATYPIISKKIWLIHRFSLHVVSFNTTFSHPNKKLKKKKHHPFVKPLGIKVVLVTSLCIASKTKVGRRDGSCVSSVAEFVGKMTPAWSFWWIVVDILKRYWGRIIGRKKS